jgi:hypothetical protein
MDKWLTELSSSGLRDFSASKLAASLSLLGVNPSCASLLSATPMMPLITWDETRNSRAISEAEWDR